VPFDLLIEVHHHFPLLLMCNYFRFSSHLHGGLRGALPLRLT
jgi:hypothetical protein